MSAFVGPIRYHDLQESLFCGLARRLMPWLGPPHVPSALFAFLSRDLLNQYALLDNQSAQKSPGVLLVDAGQPP